MAYLEDEVEETRSVGKKSRNPYVTSGETRSRKQKPGQSLQRRQESRSFLHQSCLTGITANPIWILFFAYSGA